jgi:dihydroorotase
MKTTLLRQVTPLFSGSHPEKNPVDVLIRGTKVEAVKPSLAFSADEEINAAGLHLAPGFFDFSVTVPEPGFEQKETIESACLSALKGGVTSFLLMPDGKPCNDNKGITDWRLQKASSTGVKIIPAGALSKGMEGKELAEMADLFSAGCRVFTDNKNRIRNAKLLQLALLYTKPFGGIILHTPGEFSLSQGGVMNESELSARLGLRGIPALAEELGLTRDLFLAEYCDAPIIAGPVTCAGSVEIIRRAKEKGVKVKAFTSPHYILLTEAELAQYDSYVKLDPPLRKAKDVEALKQGLTDGTLDFIASDHTPEDAEHKMIEFEHASFGMIGLQTLFSASRTGLSSAAPEDLIRLLSINPRVALDIPVPGLKEGATCEFVLFSWDEVTIPTAEEEASLSRNSVLYGKPLKGKVHRVFVG